MVCTLTVAQRQTLSDVEYYCGNKPADVLFILDVSNSIWGPDFQKQLVFVNDVIRMFEIADNVTRVGVTTFSSHVHGEIYLDDYFDKDDLTTAVSRIRQRHGFSTNTGLALWHMRRRMFAEKRGGRKNVAKVAIVLTDGQSQNMGRTVYEAIKAKQKKISVFAIGIGSRINERELNGIASRPTSEFMFKVDGYSALDAIKSTLAVRTCRVTTPSTTTTTTTTTTTSTTTTTTTTTTPTTTTSLYDAALRVCAGRRTDVVFAIDSSDNIADEDYIKQADFFNRIAEALDISPESTRVGSFLYSDQIQEMFNVVDYESLEGVKKGLSKLGMTAGGSRVDLALRHMLTKSFRRSYTRPEASQVGIIITGSPARYLEQSKHIAKKSSKAGVKYIAIGVGGNVDDEELRIITGSDESRIYRLDSFDDLETIVGQVALQTCEVPVPAPTVQDQPCGSKQEADIMFLMDSLNAGKRNTRRALAFMKLLINELDIENDNIHIGLMSAECQDDVTGFGLGAHSSKIEFEKTIDNMKGTDFHKILHNMRRHSFRNQSGARKHAKKIAILIIDGSLEEPLKTLTEAQRAKIHGVEVYVVQVGEDEPQEELLMMCDDPSVQRFFNVKSYTELEKLKDRLLQSLCDEL